MSKLSPPITFRLSVRAYQRVGTLQRKLADDPAQLGEVTFSGILRMVVERGLEAVEAELLVGPTAPSDAELAEVARLAVEPDACGATCYLGSQFVPDVDAGIGHAWARPTDVRACIAALETGEEDVPLRVYCNVAAADASPAYGWAEAIRYEEDLPDLRAAIARSEDELA